MRTWIDRMRGTVSNSANLNALTLAPNHRSGIFFRVSSPYASSGLSFSSIIVRVGSSARGERE